MYSRRFEEKDSRLPSGYGGVAFGNDRRAERGDAFAADKREDPAFSARADRPEAFGEPGGFGRPENDGGGPDGGGTPGDPSGGANDVFPDRRYMRRPAYAPPRSTEDLLRPDREDRGEKGGRNGGFRGLSFAGRSLSLEDIILAGVILLLTADGKESGQDGELLFILALLLLAK